MNSGQVEQIGTPREIYCDPASPFVARFLEMTNILPAIIQTHNGKSIAVTTIGEFPIDSNTDGNVSLLMRPDLARLDDAGPFLLRGILKEISFRGSWQRISIVVDQTTLVFEFPSLVLLPYPGGEITISLDPVSAIKIFPANNPQP
jgi:ABC-type Fe3+/spermidine/putrescine transport system ATPase subunit